MKRKIAFIEEVARKTSIPSAIIENDIAYMAGNIGRIEGEETVLAIPWGYLDSKYDYMLTETEWTNKDGVTRMVPNEEEQAWLVELEDAGFIVLDSDDVKEEWIIYFRTRYLIERCA